MSAAKIALVALLLAVVAACGGPDNTDPRKGRVTIARENCFSGGCYWDWKVCNGPNLIVNAGDVKRTYSASPECKP